MLKDNSQLKLSLSTYQGIYDAIIPTDHLLRRINENIDFSFVNPMLRQQYCENLGSPAKEPDMAYKFFSGSGPGSENNRTQPSREIQKDPYSEDVLEEMLKETIQLRDMSKQLRKEIYKNAFELSEKFPEKPFLEAGLEEEIVYTKELLLALEDGIAAWGNEKIQGISKKMKELIHNIEERKLPLTKVGVFQCPLKSMVSRWDMVLTTPLLHLFLKES